MQASKTRVAAVLVVAALLASGPSAGVVQAQSAQPAAGESWEPGRTADGQPGLEGIWRQRSDISTYSIQASAIDREEHTRIGGQATQFGRPIVDPRDGMIPYQPWAAERAKFLNVQHRAPQKLEYLDPVSRCFMSGVPRMVYQGASSTRILQFPDKIVFLHEWWHHYRVVYLDNRPRVPEGIRLWMGDSRGRWEGNTLVVEVTNNSEKTWFDIVGNFHGDRMKVTERWTRTGPDTIEYIATMDDPTVYTRPWTIRVELGRGEPEEQWEHAGCEGNKAVHVAFDLPFEHEVTQANEAAN